MTEELKLLEDLLKFSSKYEISIQFWPQQTAVYICKDGIALKDFGGRKINVLRDSLEYLQRINSNKKP